MNKFSNKINYRILIKLDISKSKWKYQRNLVSEFYLLILFINVLNFFFVNVENARLWLYTTLINLSWNNYTVIAGILLVNVSCNL